MPSFCSWGHPTDYQWYTLLNIFATGVCVYLFFGQLFNVLRHMPSHQQHDKCLILCAHGTCVCVHENYSPIPLFALYMLF